MTNNPKHDYARALDWFEDSFSDHEPFEVANYVETIRHALRLAIAVTGELSDESCETAAAVPIHADEDAWNKSRFKAIIAQIEREITQ